VRRELCAEALRLALLLATLMPDEAEVHGLHALLLFQDARRDARVRAGALVLLDDQDRDLWDRPEIEQGRAALERALALRAPGPYQVQAAIASLHTEPETDWRQIAQLYGRLAAWQRSPVVDLNRAVAVAMAEGPERGLELVQAIDGLDDYYLFHATRADLLRRLGEPADEAYRRALELAPSDVERDFLRRRLLER
jgi:RNA polymerase sigma-70 factor (ECF subfamily)